jgi:hypothetical protein
MAFFAGFCLIVNGAYLGAGAFFAAGDSADLLRYGAPPWQLILFGVLACAGGLFLWHGLGPNFGLRQPGGHVDRRAAILACAAFFVMIVTCAIASWN